MIRRTRVGQNCSRFAFFHRSYNPINVKCGVTQCAFSSKLDSFIFCAVVLIIKFHFWNLSGYSDLSVEEGTVGGRERICVE